MAAPPYLQTARLRLRPRCRDDIDAILEMEIDPDIYRYSDLRPHLLTTAPDRGAHRKALRQEIRSGSPRDFWIIEWKDRPGFLGLIGLTPTSPGIKGLPVQEGTTYLVFRLIKSAWGQGIATEAAQAILDYGFRVLMCPMIAAFSHVENGRSGKVLEKLGMGECGRIVVPQQSPQPSILMVKTLPSVRDTFRFHLLDREPYISRAQK